MLDHHVWAPLKARVGEETERNPTLAARWGEPDNAGALCDLVLEAATRWAIESAGKGAEVRKGAERLKAIDANLIDTMHEALRLLEERDELSARDGLCCDPPAIVDDLEELIEVAAKRYPAWHSVVGHELEAFLHVSSETSQEGPRLIAILEAAIHWRGSSEVSAIQPDAAEVLRPQPGRDLGSPAARTRQFLAVLDKKCGVITAGSSERVGPLQWIGPTALAHLLSVFAEGTPADPGEVIEKGAKRGLRFNIKAVGKVRREYLHQPAKAVKRRP